MSDLNILRAKLGQSALGLLPFVGGTSSSDTHGYADYNDTSTSASPLVLVDDVWTSIPNNGAGASTNNNLPNGLNSVLDKSNGNIVVDELPINSAIWVRMDFSVNALTNNSALDFRFQLGGGPDVYYLEDTVSRLDEGSDKTYPKSFLSYIYVGDLNTQNNPIIPQVKLTGGGTLVNSGSVIEVRKANNGD